MVDYSQYRFVRGMRQYRLIYDIPASGSYNMAVDAAIMRSVASGEGLPTLRLYAWEPACLSLGYGQTWHDVDLARLSKHGWELVRRPTGGRAILHTDELTYSITVPESHELAKGTIPESYRRISQALAAALGFLGTITQANVQTVRSTDSDGPVCFEVKSHYEIAMLDGRKLIGSAQVRRAGVVLQHGTLPLHGDVARICDALVFSGEAERDLAKARVRSRAATLEDALGQVISWQSAADALANAFATTFDAHLFEGSLSTSEHAEAKLLENGTYGAESFTLRR